MARIPYPERSAEAVDALPTPLNAFRMFSHAPDMTGPAIDLGMAVLGSSLPVRLRELVVVTVAARTDCAYGVVQHRPIALLTGGSPPTNWPPSSNSGPRTASSTRSSLYC
ncbi:carboxymuconolactone decarboxylase family protein [Streptomyces sp. NBC_01478]|uniref:carboxymuconolactone decarboxylase family protein n=1 Tax=Streptomyces sp. NBC_01478 TaxID=2903882 RepID=UPI002E3100C7|nr:carboxymuconolactone decarboxylase family protein [Streptomyces sp. NBC_01478]